MSESAKAYEALQSFLILTGAQPTPELSSACLLLAARIHQKRTRPDEAKALWMDRCERVWQHVEEETRDGDNRS